MKIGTKTTTLKLKKPRKRAIAIYRRRATILYPL